MKKPNLKPVLVFAFLFLGLYWSCSDEDGAIAPVKKQQLEQKEFPITDANRKTRTDNDNGRVTASSCGTTVDGSYYGNGFYVYPDRALDLSNVSAGTTVTVSCTAHEVPNRIAVYSGGSQVASTGWIGYSSNPGPWGSSLNGPSNKTITFTMGSLNNYFIRTETVTQGISDYWAASISCPVVPVCCVTGGASYYDTYYGNGYYLYPDKNITFCSTATGRTGVVYCTANEIPNRFNIYNSGNLIATTGWIGYSSNPGPWGSSLNGPSSASMTFTINSTTYQLRVETVTQGGISDAWNTSAGCQN
jgi:hypothetical protein